MAAERRFSLLTKIKTATRSRLSEAKARNLKTIATTSVFLYAFDYAQASIQFKSMQTREFDLSIGILLYIASFIFDCSGTKACVLVTPPLSLRQKRKTFICFVWC